MGKNRGLGPSATWSHESIIMFCDLCLQEIVLGNRPNTHFSKAGWMNLVENFKEYTGRDYDRLQLKNKWDQLKKEWKLWKELKKGAVGSDWNPKRKTIDCSNEWWKEKIEEFPLAKKFRYSGIDPEMEEKLDKMFMSAAPGSDNTWAPNSESLPPGTTDDNDHGDFEDCDSTKSLSGDAKIVNELSRPYSGLKRASQPSSLSKGCKSKACCPKYGMSGSAGEVPHMLQVQIQQLVDAAVLRSKATAALSKSFSITEAVGALDSIEELEEDTELYGFSIDLLMQKDSRELFMALKPHKKAWYLKREFEKAKKNAC